MPVDIAPCGAGPLACRRLSAGSDSRSRLERRLQAESPPHNVFFGFSLEPRNRESR